MLEVSTNTIDYWYRFKRLHPENKYAKMLPDYEQEGNRQTRYWTISDVHKLKKFKKLLPRGRRGILTDVTQRYTKKRTENDE